MKITQLIPAPPGVNAVYVDCDSDSGVVSHPVYMFAVFVDDNGRTAIDAVSYARGPGFGFEACSVHEEFLGILNPGEHVEKFEDAEARFREETGGFDDEQVN